MTGINTYLNIQLVKSKFNPYFKKVSFLEYLNLLTYLRKTKEGQPLSSNFEITNLQLNIKSSLYLQTAANLQNCEHITP